MTTKIDPVDARAVLDPILEVCKKFQPKGVEPPSPDPAEIVCWLLQMRDDEIRELRATAAAYTEVRELVKMLKDKVYPDEPTGIGVYRRNWGREMDRRDKAEADRDAWKAAAEFYKLRAEVEKVRAEAFMEEINQINLLFAED